MTRFEKFDELSTGLYTREEVARMTDQELADAINACEEWEPALLEDLIWRYDPDLADAWECGDPVLYTAAEHLGVVLD